jgi:hypothetical protein
MRHLKISKDKRYQDVNKRVKDRRTELIRKSGSKCFDCQVRYDDYMYDFHHVDPDSKKFTLTGKNLTRRWKDVLIEFEKCVLLCPNCHRTRHHLLDNKKG